jgi:cell division septation protein DedD
MITEERANYSGGLGRRSRMEGEEAEITLGMRSLLGIFFGLVLICGIFFGLGYSVGRSGGSKAAPDDTTVANAAANTNLKKPSADQSSLTPAPTLAPVPDSTTQSAENAASAPAVAAEEPRTQALTAAARLAQAAPPVVRTVTATPRPAQVSTPAITPQPIQQRPAVAQTVSPAAVVQTGSFMVQIAAVRLQQDANVLVTALQRRGYSVVVRNEPQDALLHVQIGPFPSRNAAFAMRSRLLADGYNAVVK